MVKNMLENKLAYSEVYEILNLLDNKYISKVPKNIIDFFEEERMKEYKPEINLDIPLTEQKLKRKTMILLSILNLDYWCENEDEKKKAKEQFIINENEKRKLAKKYNPDNLFKKQKENKLQNEKIELIEYKKDNFVKRIFDKIKRLLRK